MGRYPNSLVVDVDVLVVVWEVRDVCWSKRLTFEKGTDGLVLLLSSETRVIVLSLIIGIELSSDALRAPDG